MDIQRGHVHPGANRRVGATLAAAVVMAACSHANVIQPSSPPNTFPPLTGLHLLAGRNYLFVVSLGISDDPKFPPCTPLGQPPGGTGVTTEVDLTQVGAAWVARSPLGMGSLEIQIQEKGPFEPGVPNMVGQVSGLANDTGGPSRAPNGVSLSVTGEPLSLEGKADFTNYVSTGRFDGPHIYVDAFGRVGRCTAAMWIMEPVGRIMSNASRTAFASDLLK